MATDRNRWLEPLYTADQMRALDAWAIEKQRVPSLDLMERAGILGGVGTIIAFAVFIGAPEYFKSKFDTRWNDVEQRANKQIQEFEKQSTAIEQIRLKRSATTHA